MRYNPKRLGVFPPVPGRFEDGVRNFEPPPEIEDDAPLARKPVPPGVTIFLDSLSIFASIFSWIFLFSAFSSSFFCLISIFIFSFSSLCFAFDCANDECDFFSV